MPRATTHFAAWGPPSPATSVCLSVIALVYLGAWWAWWRKMPGRIPFWRLGAFLAGVALVGIAWSSWLSRLTHFLLVAHMVQHLLFMLLSPPLVLLGSPVFVFAYRLLRKSLPDGEAQSGVFDKVPGRRLARSITHPVTAGLVMVAVTIAWHVPPVFELAMRSPGWHTFENVTFLGSGILFWWPVILPWPSTKQWPRWTIPVYLLAADLPVSALTAYLAFCGHVVYPAYASVPRVFGITALDDQVAAAMLMWVAMLLVFLGAAVAVVMELLEPSAPRRSAGDGRPLPSGGRRINS